MAAEKTLTLRYLCYQIRNAAWKTYCSVSWLSQWISHFLFPTFNRM